MLLILCALLAIATAQNSPPVSGTATIVVDLRGFSEMVQVSIDNKDVFVNQGGAVRRYVVATTNAVRDFQVIITEGAAASVTRTLALKNDMTVELDDIKATLEIHLENYDAPVFTVKLRVESNGNQNVFRQYSDLGGPQYTLPLSDMGSVPSASSFTVHVLRTEEPVTVWVGEYFEGNVAVNVVGHDGNGLAVESDCSDGSCDSGRLVARATVEAQCNGSEDYPMLPIDLLELVSNPSPTVTPVEVVRRWNNVGPARFVWYVLAVDNYQVQATVDDIEKVSALNCAIGECEANPLTSILTVYHSTLQGDVQVAVLVDRTYRNYGSAFDLMGAPRTDTQICVLNLPNTRATARFTTGGQVRNGPINCGLIEQTCDTYVYATVTPQYSCLHECDPSVATVVRSGSSADGQIVYENWGCAPSTIVVPAMSDLYLWFYDGKTQWTPENAVSPKVTDEVSASFELTSCQAVNDVTTKSQDGNAPGECATLVRVDRMLSIFDLAFLPAIEAGYQGQGQIPENGDSSNVTVSLRTANEGVWRYLENQGGEPRMYCVLPVELETKIEESCSCWNSEVISCVQEAFTVETASSGADFAGSDCAACDFLSILQYDLTGLPREVNSVIYAGPRDGVPVTVVDESFESFNIGTSPCEEVVDGASLSPAFQNFYPANNNIEVWREGCNGAPNTFPNGEATGNTLKVGDIDPSLDGKPEPLPLKNSTCVRFVVPKGVTQLNVAFYAWQHGNGNFDTNARVVFHGESSGVSLKAWIQVTPDAWTKNAVQLLNVHPEEVATMCFEQVGKYGTQVDDIVVAGQQFDLCPIRWMYWQGNYFNQIPVLRSASGKGCPYEVFGRYCVRVFDGSAYKEECVACDDKTCEPFYPFKCDMCLDLAAPNDQPGIENGITVSINVGGSNIRDIPGQGGTNGCILQKKEVSSAQRKFAELEHKKEMARGLTPEVLQRLEMAEVEKMRRDILTEITNEYKERAATRSGPYQEPGQTQSIFPVLCLNYRVCVSEACVEPVCFDVDCTKYGTCSYENIVALGSINFDECANLPSDLGLTLYSEGSQFEYETGQLKPETGCQVRGPTGQMILDSDTCVWSPPKFIGPSYENVGRGVFTFPLLRTNYQVRLDENTLGFEYGEENPESLQHPYSVANIDCTDSDVCEASMGLLTSKWQVRSERGLPEEPEARLGLKFGINSQNLIRSIPSFQLQAPGWNDICVLADKRPWYNLLWGTWNSQGANLPYSSCASNTTTVDYCRDSVIVPPRSK